MKPGRSENFHQLLRGALLAAALILPTTGHTVPSALAAETQSSWITLPSRSFEVQRVRLKDLVANISVQVGPGPVTLQMSGDKQRLDAVDVHKDGGVLTISGHSHYGVWDWHDWFSFGDTRNRAPSQLKVTLRVPAGTELSVHSLIGNAQIGNTMGRLDFGAISTHSNIGQVAQAHIRLAGSGTLQLAGVHGPLKLDIAGSGKITVGQSGPVHADLAGAGDAHLGQINGGLSLDIAGSGNAVAQSVNGPVKVDIAGSGSVHIAAGTADPLHLDIMGSGNFAFGGHAVDPHLSALGSGSVWLSSYSGNLSTSGNVHLSVGQNKSNTSAWH
ncbi:MAG: hypothetical protein ACP5QR_06885 [Rhizomicrobium sp.]